jgi:hypothetical protein
MFWQPQHRNLVQDRFSEDGLAMVDQPQTKEYKIMRSKRILAMAAAVTMGCAWLMAAQAPLAHAATCTSNDAVCLFANKSAGGALLTGRMGVSAVELDFTKVGFNDVTSSIYNTVGYTQSFWVNINETGSKLSVGAYTSVPNLDNGSGWNDVISSMAWIGW